MESVFPFGFSRPTAFYLTLYVLTLVVHVVFMNYVFAGCGYLAAVSLFTGGPDVRRQMGPMALVLRDWMPFALSAAITAGIAPLLFIQILYRVPFYTANLLLFHRWMAILPVLIVGFYLLYLLKSRVIGEWPAAARIIVGCGAFLCIAFTGYSWTENHLLSLHSQSWTSFYEQGRIFYWHPALLPRLGMWLFGAIPTMITGVSWQLFFAARRGGDSDALETRRASDLALGGLLLSALCCAAYFVVGGEPVRRQFTSLLAAPYLIAAIGGAGLQAVAWVKQRQQPELSWSWLLAASVGVMLTITGMSVVREALRLGALDISAFTAQHAAAAEKGGLLIFLLFCAINALVIGGCVLAVRGGLQKPSHTEAAG